MQSHFLKGILGISSKSNMSKSNSLVSLMNWEKHRMGAKKKKKKSAS